jgi:hypothetical protein
VPKKSKQSEARESPYYPVAITYVGQVPRGASLPQFFMVEGVGQCLIKFKQNPQGPRVLVNEYVGFELASALGLDHPPCGIVDVDPASLPNNGVLELLDADGDRLVYKPGLHFYSKWLDPKDEVFAEDVRGLKGAVNAGMLAGVVVLDLLLGNWDRKPLNSNLILHREKHQQKLKLIDLSMAFGSGIWEIQNLQDYDLPPLNATLPYSHPPKALLESVNHYTDFSPYLAKLKTLGRERLEAIVKTVPDEWSLNAEERKALVDCLEAKIRSIPSYLQKRLTRGKEWWK